MIRSDEDGIRCWLVITCRRLLRNSRWLRLVDALHFSLWWINWGQSIRISNLAHIGLWIGASDRSPIPMAIWPPFRQTSCHWNNTFDVSLDWRDYNKPEREKAQLEHLDWSSSQAEASLQQANGFYISESLLELLLRSSKYTSRSVVCGGETR